MPGLGASFGRGGATTYLQDLGNADCILIQGSNMAEAHPVGFQWVMEAKRKGATVIHVDPRFTRTSAVADLHVPIRAGTDIAFLGALVNHVLSNDLDFREYVVAYTNAANDHRRGLRRTPRTSTGCSPASTRRPAPTTRRTWRYDAAGDPTTTREPRDERRRTSGRRRAAVARGGALRERTAPAARPVDWKGRRDETLQHPRCVFQILKRHFARYTPEMVQEVCGIAPERVRARSPTR